MPERITEAEISSAIEPLAMDMTALFRMMEGDVIQILDRGVNENWTPERIVYEIDKLLGDENVNSEI